MAISRVIILKDFAHREGAATIELTAALCDQVYSPFVRILYDLNGIEMEYALRLDLEKRIIADRLENDVLDQWVRSQTADVIATIVSMTPDLRPYQITTDGENYHLSGPGLDEHHSSLKAVDQMQRAANIAYGAGAADKCIEIKTALNII